MACGRRDRCADRNIVPRRGHIGAADRGHIGKVAGYGASPEICRKRRVAQQCRPRNSAR